MEPTLAVPPQSRAPRLIGLLRALWRHGASRDLVAVAIVGVVAFLLSAQLELNERVVAWGQSVGEFYGFDIDDLPAGISLLSVGIAWYAWRRRSECVRETEQHRATAAKLALAMREATAAQAELETANRRLRDAIETIPEGFVLFDADDRYVLWNKQYEAIYDKSADIIAVGRRFEDALRLGAVRGQYPQAEGRVEQWVAARLAQHARQHGSLEQKLPDGRWLRIEERSTSDGGSIGIRVDITALKEREAELGEARDRAEAASRAKSNFLANMSHELRTPLNAILGFSEIIATEAFGRNSVPAYRDYARDIHGAGTHLLGIISDILDLARVEAGKLQLRIAAVDAAAMADEVARMLADQCARAEVALRLDIKPNLPPVQADSGRLRQVLLNMLQNAIKFTPAGGSAVLAARLAPPSNQMILEVSDTGIGIAAEDLAIVLAPFGQIESALARCHEGTGLGLPLAKSLVEAMGGSFQLASTVGQGTRITISLPASDAPGAAAALQRAPAALIL